MKISFILYDESQGEFLTSLGFIREGEDPRSRWEGDFDLLRDKQVRMNRVCIPFSPLPTHLTIDGKVLFSIPISYDGERMGIVFTKDGIEGVFRSAVPSNVLYPLVEGGLKEAEEMRRLGLSHSDLLKKREEEKAKQKEISTFQERITSLEVENKILRGSLEEAGQKIASRNRIIKRLRKIRISLSE